MSMSEHGLTDECLKQIGSICVSFSALEDQTAFFISVFNESNSQAEISKLGFSRKKEELLSAVYRNIESEKEREKFMELMDKIEKAGQRRDQIIHSAWFTEVKTNTLSLSKAEKEKKKNKYKSEIITETQLKKDAQEIFDITKEFINYMVYLISTLNR